MAWVLSHSLITYKRLGMSRRKKKLYAQKYQPWYLKKNKLAAGMERALVGPPKQRGKAAGFGGPSGSAQSLLATSRRSISELREVLDDLQKKVSEFAERSAKYSRRR